MQGGRLDSNHIILFIFLGFSLVLLRYEIIHMNHNLLDLLQLGVNLNIEINLILVLDMENLVIRIKEFITVVAAVNMLLLISLIEGLFIHLIYPRSRDLESSFTDGLDP